MQRTFSSLTSDRPFMVPLPPFTNTEAAWRPTAVVALIGKGLHSKDLKLLPDICKDSKKANRLSLQRSVKPRGARRMFPVTGRRCRGGGTRLNTDGLESHSSLVLANNFVKHYETVAVGITALKDRPPCRPQAVRTPDTLLTGSNELAS